VLNWKGCISNSPTFLSLALGFITKIHTHPAKFNFLKFLSHIFNLPLDFKDSFELHFGKIQSPDFHCFSTKTVCFSWDFYVFFWVASPDFCFADYCIAEKLTFRKLFAFRWISVWIFKGFSLDLPLLFGCISEKLTFGKSKTNPNTFYI